MIARSVLVASLLSLAPLTASAAIDIDGPGGDDGGGGGGGGGTGGGGTQPPPPDWSRSYAKSDYWGSSSWGAGYAVNGSITAKKATATTRDKLTAAMSAETYARINGGRYRLFSGRVNGNTEAKARTDLSINAYAGSANIFTRSYVSQTSTYVFTNLPQYAWGVTFFDVQANVSLFVPVSFRAKATGELRINLTGKISNVGIEAGATPQGRAGLYAYGAVGAEYCVGPACVGASAGVYVDVTLLSVAAPASVSALLRFSGLNTAVSGVQLTYGANASLNLSSLDGELGVFAEACLGGCIGDSTTLINWNGFSATASLISESGSLCLAGTCIAAPPPVVVGMAL